MMAAVGDYYSLLSVDAGASSDEIQAAYRSLASMFHPDTNHSQAATIMFRKVKAAYDVLIDADARARYDRALADAGTQALNVSTVISRDTVLPGSDTQWLYAMATLEPPPDQTGGAGAPLNLALVIDRSTSMQGGRMDQMKAAVHRIIDDLSEMDIVAIITFSDRAEVIIPATKPTDRRTMKATVSTMRASGATAIYAGLKEGIQELSKNLHSRYTNHIIMITDGRTYGDEDDCIRLAGEARDEGIGISAMGLGDDWNDEFLDELASTTGTSSSYIASANAVSMFIENRIRSLGTAYAERASLLVAPTPDVRLDKIFRVSPDPTPLNMDEHPIALGMLDAITPTSILMRFSLTTNAELNSQLLVGRVMAEANVLGSNTENEMGLADITVTVAQDFRQLPPPAELSEAVDKLTLYEMQERAQAEVTTGQIDDATNRLTILATRLFEHGEDELAQAALHEAERVASTKVISDEGRKRLKYGTRALVPPQDGAQ